ncbi:G2/mitotic-specific cyclin, partial [Coemansia biformis]
ASAASESVASKSLLEMASVTAQKPRIPLAAVDARKPQVFRDPVKRAVPRIAAPAVVVAAATAPQASQRGDARPLRILRASSASNIALVRPEPVKPVPVLAKPAQVAGIKRRANSAEPVRAVRARVTHDEPAASAADKLASARSDTTAVDEAERSEESAPWAVAKAVGPDHSGNESQDTAVEESKQQDAVILRRIAKPGRAFSSLRTLARPVELELALEKEAVPEKDWEDIDADDADDPLMVSEYVSEIIDYMREREMKTMPDEEYMEKQTELTWEMRCVLVNWIVQIHYQLRMLPETLYLAVNLIDRFLSRRQVSVPKLQLVGLTGLLLACKYEEMTTPHVQDFAYLAGDCYTVEEIRNAEVFMLRVVDFDMSHPSALTFLRRVSKAEHYNMQTRTVAKYLMEICLVDHRLIQFSPSHIAAAGTCLARRMLRAGPWDGNLRHYSGYTEASLQPCVALMLDHLMCPADDGFVFRKYQHKRYLKASIFCREWVARHRHEILPVTPPVGAFDTPAEVDPLFA